MLTPPIEPMLAAPLGSAIPDEAGVSFEPKWDGFRCLVFVDEAGGVVLQGRGRSHEGRRDRRPRLRVPRDRGRRPSTQVPRGTVLDGEIVVLHDGRLDFGVLSSRLRPRSEAEGTNIARLADEHPATLLVVRRPVVRARPHARAVLGATRGA